MDGPFKTSSDYPMAMDSESFKKALGQYGSGVTVITALSPGGEPVGFTATAFSSLSLDPPLVLFCIDQNSSSSEPFRQVQEFAVNFLASGQAALSGVFAGSAEDRFRDVAYRAGTRGAPLLEGCLVNLECAVQERFPGGDHTIVVGKVEAVHMDGGDPEGGEPLLYFGGRYGTVRDLPAGD